MKKSELFTKEMLETFTCHPYGRRGYYYNRLKEEGHISFFTKHSGIAEYYNGDDGVNNV